MRNWCAFWWFTEYLVALHIFSYSLDIVFLRPNGLIWSSRIFERLTHIVFDKHIYLWIEINTLSFWWPQIERSLRIDWMTMDLQLISSNIKRQKSVYRVHQMISFSFQASIVTRVITRYFWSLIVRSWIW